MGVLDSLAIGRRALSAASTGINVTSQNVANAATPGYSRRRVLQQTTDPLRRGGVWLGTGVDVNGISRASDRLLGVRVVASTGAKAQAEATEQTLSVAQGYFDETSATGLSEAYHAFYDALSSLTADPSDPSHRRAAVEGARTVATSISRTARGLEDSIDSVDTSLADYTDTINNNLREVAALNAAIGKSSPETGPGDLLDRRDELVRTLGELAGATVDLDATGQATVFIGGHAVVTGREYRTVSVAADSAGDTQIYVSSDTGKLRITDSVGGKLGGLMAARDTMSGWLSTLDDFATNLATIVNAQHALGFDATGAPGGDVFSLDPTAPASSLDVDAALAADPNLLAVAGAAAADPGDDDNLTLILDLETSATYSGTTGASALSSLTSSVGAQVATASGDAATLGAQLDDLEMQRDAVSKVDTDEEAIRLIEYQTAYRAAARVLSAGDQMLQTLMAIG